MREKELQEIELQEIFWEFNAQGVEDLVDEEHVPAHWSQYADILANVGAEQIEKEGALKKCFEQYMHPHY
jgi:hypothetical protein